MVNTCTVWDLLWAGLPAHFVVWRRLCLAVTKCSEGINWLPLGGVRSLQVTPPHGVIWCPQATLRT